MSLACGLGYTGVSMMEQIPLRPRQASAHDGKLFTYLSLRSTGIAP
jgi:hypothetical protein